MKPELDPRAPHKYHMFQLGGYCRENPDSKDAVMLDLQYSHDPDFQKARSMKLTEEPTLKEQLTQFFQRNAK
jgi:hypothetical protein